MGEKSWAGVRLTRVDPRGCYSGKKRYDRARAKIVAKMDRKRTGHFIAPYPCSGCGWWHVGHYRIQNVPKEIM